METSLTTPTWQRDPFGRHELRFWTGVRWSEHVCDEGQLSIDAIASPPLTPSVPEVKASAVPTFATFGSDRYSAATGFDSSVSKTYVEPVPTPSRKRRRVLLIVLIAIVLAGVGAFIQFGGGKSPRSTYLSALREAGVAGKFSSDETAVAHGRKVCTDLEAAGPQQGLPEDKIAVEAFCPKFIKGFKVLRTSTVKGTFLLRDSSPSSSYPSIITSAGACEGSNGYNDIDSGTQVTVENSAGRLLAQTSLGPGKGTRTSCTFSFEVTLTEGEDRYIIEVGRRGTLSHSFTELDIAGIALTLGD